MNISISEVGTSFAAAKYIREVGRGAYAARSLTQQDTYELFAAMLAGRVSDLELGALLLAWRVKGESVAELAGMLAAAHETCHTMSFKRENISPVIIPSYNGSRKQPNLVPLLAMLLAREGVPVMIHGTTTFGDRITTAMLFDALDLPICSNLRMAEAQLANERLAFVPIEVLSPALAAMLDKRNTIGLRNSAHTIVKMLQPLGNHTEQEALRLVNFTHPEYLHTLTEYFGKYPANVLLARGTEGEAVVDARRMVNILRINNGQQYLMAEAEKGLANTLDLPNGLDVKATASYIQDVLAGKREVPAPIAEQVSIILQAAS